jgi:PhoPQ-activated pathogenicity-related protein
MLNLQESFKHHFEVYGAYSLAVSDYVLNGNIAWLGTPEFKALMEIVEPFEYRARLELPKFLLNSTGDEFFLPDSWQFYWDQLIGDKHLRYVPNSNHGMGETDVGESLDAWYHAIVHNVKIPRYSWEVAEDGTITVLSLDKPSKVLLWQASNSEDRNFMQTRIGKAYHSSPLSEIEPGVYKVKLAPPETGYTAYYIELEFESGVGFPFKFSTGTKVVPDVSEYDWAMSPASARE